MEKFTQIDLHKTPKHIAIIMDGNGRWAKKQGKERLFGHNLGVEAVRETLKAANKMNIKFLTLYAFSTENWNRPKEEVDGLMDLLVNSILAELPELMESNVKLLTIGDTENLPETCKKTLLDAIQTTKNNTGISLVLALNYSAKWELVNATKQIADLYKNNQITIEGINDALIDQFLTTSEIPDPELLIRTSGEHRISNFLLWQIAYTELYFTNILWPDFKAEDLYDAVIDYQQRERRFGLVSEQLI